MTHTHDFKEITHFGHTEQHFRCVLCGTETTKPFPDVNPSTGVVEGTGVTREDVTFLREVVRGYESGDWGFHFEEKIAKANSLADRIEALLPPE